MTSASARTTQPRLPPGQTLTAKWPVLTYGETPRVDLRSWTFRGYGLLEEDVSWTWEEFTLLDELRQDDVLLAIKHDGSDLPAEHADAWREERYSDQETRAMQRMRAEAARRSRGR
jgi:DMSO/TMAO reductase YedYZ molybdopterin-dependent catalytic subunit